MSNHLLQQPIVFLCRIPSCENADCGKKRATQSEYARKLLDYAYAKQFGLDLATQNLRVDENGKPMCNQGYFSIAHSGDYACVAASNAPVGVDIQKFNGVKSLTVAKRFFTEEEKRQLDECENDDGKIDCFYLTWCKKEALWKSLEAQPATVAPVNTTASKFFAQKLQLDGETYYLAVTDENANIVFVEPTEF